ncbi:hypothetical protein QMZ93_01195 [Pantoea stewartii subsp. indologenes]|uniref:hypothetical protein n=1 Tax=Pantoea stewartii TaxID=66269 RepID=UPI0024DF7EAE|nr:hypothetical protein [Pantoea stewartii]MDK2631962.1 hypothetical protein [Pantoea stewartii subsp. indologenes]
MKTTIRIDQMKLVTAISFELSRQYPGVTVDADQFNAIIAAANSVKAAYDGTEVEFVEGDEEDA